MTKTIANEKTRSFTRDKNRMALRGHAPDLIQGFLKLAKHTGGTNEQHPKANQRAEHTRIFRGSLRQKFISITSAPSLQTKFLNWPTISAFAAVRSAAILTSDSKRSKGEDRVEGKHCAHLSHVERIPLAEGLTAGVTGGDSCDPPVTRHHVRYVL